MEACRNLTVLMRCHRWAQRNHPEIAKGGGRPVFHRRPCYDATA